MNYNITIEEIVGRIYPEEESASAIKLLQNLGFYAHISSCVSIVNEKLNCERDEIKDFGAIQLSTVSSCLLSGTNERLRLMSNAEKTNDIEQVIADVSKQIIEFVLQHTESDKNIVINQIAYSLHDTCVIFNYDEDALAELIGFRNLQHHASVLLTGKEVKNSEIPKELRFYKWKGKLDKKDSFISLFLDKNLIVNNSKKNFHKLFDSYHEPLLIKFNKEKRKLLMTFFHQLKNKHKLLRLNGQGGFYTPLKQHGIDFHSEILEKKPPRAFNDALTKNTSEWLENTKTIDKWLENII